MNFVNIKNVAFCGKTRFLSCNSEGKGRTVSDCPFGTAYFGETRGLSQFVQKHSYPFASVEETIGKVHDNKTYKIYVADPFEVVDDIIRKNHDYIVHDVEPLFPDIHKCFDVEQDKIKKEFKVLSDYYKRLEIASLVSGNMETFNISKNKQNITNICLQMFNESSDLRTKIRTLLSKSNCANMRINDIEDNLSKYKRELLRKRTFKQSNEKTLKIKEESLRKLLDKRALLKENMTRTPEDVEAINSAIQRYGIVISELKEKIKMYGERIEFLEKYIEDAPRKIENNRADIQNYQEKITMIKNALMPNLKKLQEFYKVNGIKIVKHV